MIRAKLIPLMMHKKYFQQIDAQGLIPLCVSHIPSDDGLGYLLVVTASEDSLPGQETDKDEDETDGIKNKPSQNNELNEPEVIENDE